jgi:LuxR family transcriptional regulator, quorum-sensing system regulator BjaR1
LPALHLMAIYAFDRILKLRGSPAPHQASLTPREREILTLVANGKSTWEIGETLHISGRTVKEHIKHLCRRLGAVTRAQAVMIAVRDRIIQPGGYHAELSICVRNGSRLCEDSKVRSATRMMFSSSN